MCVSAPDREAGPDDLHASHEHELYAQCRPDAVSRSGDLSERMGCWGPSKLQPAGQREGRPGTLGV